MLRWFQALMPREDRFFALFNRHAATLVDGAEALQELLKGGPGVEAAEGSFSLRSSHFSRIMTLDTPQLRA